MLDIETLRVAQACVAVSVFVLVFFGTFRATRAPFAGWWSAALFASGATSAVYLVDGDDHSSWAAVVGNGLSVTGAVLVCAAARSLRGLRVPRRLVPVPGLVFGAATAIEAPRGDAWPGGVSLLVGMALFLTVGATELWRLARERRDQVLAADAHDAGICAAVVSMAIASTVVSAFYVVRVVVFLVPGPSSTFYQEWAGPQMTTLLMMVMLVAVTYAVLGLNQLEEANRWRARALRDDLTGLLNRAAFGERALQLMDDDEAATRRPAVVVADLDHFKSVNDVHGHAEGDKVLTVFARAVERALGPRDLAARLGGEEFVVLVGDGGVERARAVVGRIGAAYSKATGRLSATTTVSYGVAARRDGESLDDLVARADAAMYRAKRAGRDRVVVAAGDAVDDDAHPVHATRRESGDSDDASGGGA